MQGVGKDSIECVRTRAAVPDVEDIAFLEGKFVPIDYIVGDVRWQIQAVEDVGGGGSVYHFC